jgi:hypothetical protein
MCRSRSLAVLALLVALLPASAATGRVMKVLPHYLDRAGRHTIAPSLYERDAYQDHLRQNPDLRSGLRFDVRWRARDVDLKQLRLRVDLRGIVGNKVQVKTIERSSLKRSFWENWTGLLLDEEDLRSLGELNAWRVTLWQGDTLLDEYKSFLW